jgi:hypothetical protein
VRSEWSVERLGAAPPADSPPTILALIERVALDTRADVEKLDRVMAMYDRLKAKGAELAFNAAKGRILKKLAGIKIVMNRPVLSEIEKGKPQKATFEAFKYAPLEEIDKHLRPLLAEEAMDLSYSDEPWAGGGILIRGRLKHLPSGHYEDSFMPAPLDTTGGKSSVQAVGSTNSSSLITSIERFAARYQMAIDANDARTLEQRLRLIEDRFEICRPSAQRGYR